MPDIQLFDTIDLRVLAGVSRTDRMRVDAISVPQVLALTRKA